MRKPGDGFCLAASRRVLDQVAPARAVSTYIGEGRPHYAELVVARPHLFALLLAGARVSLLDDLRLVLDDVGQPCWCEHLFPEIVSLETIWIGWVAGAAVVALVEREEP